MAIKLTSKIVKSVDPPGTLWDTEVKGFGVRASRGGAKSFFIDYRIEGREGRYTIGRFPTWSPEAARDEAKALRQQIDRGEDPARGKRERREAATVQELIDRYIDEHLPTKAARPDRINDEKKMLAEIGERLGKDSKVADIHDGDIEAMHRKITETGRPVRANRILAVASKMFSLSLRSKAGENRPWRNQAQGNPCKGIKRNPETAREHFFSPAELARISDALAAYDGSTEGNTYKGSAADCIRLIMLCGCRPAEAQLATWDQFDAEPGFWKKPAATTKQRKEHKLAIGAAVIELIERRRRHRKPADRYVFPGQKSGEPLKQLWHCWRFVQTHAGIGRARIYDLRHSFASVGAAGGVSLLVVGKLLGHSTARSTQRYAHLADDPMREAAEKITKVITGAKKPGAKVIGLKA
jgi:integrase